MLFQSELVKEIKNEAMRGNVVFLTGAAISKGPPALLPLGLELSDALATCIFKSDEAEIIKNLHIRPEVLFESTQKVIKKRIFNLFNIFAVPNPTLSHIYLASLESSIMTTNFDDLHEQACTLFGFKKISKTRREVVFENNRGHKIRIVKLHGGYNEPKSIMAFLDKIYQGFEKQVLDSCRLSIRNRILVVLGYSCQDKDVFEALANSELRKIVWVDISFDSEAMSFRNQLLRQFPSRKIRCDVISFCARLRTLKSEEPNLKGKASGNEWKSQINRFYESLLVDELDGIRGRVLQHIGLTERALVIFEMLIKMWRRNKAMQFDKKRPERMALDYLELARCQRLSHKPYDKVRMAFEESKSMFEKSGDWKKQCDLLFEMGALAIEHSRWNEAGKSYNEMSKIAQSHRSRNHRALADVGIATLHYWQSVTSQDFVIAQKTFEEASEFLKRSGRYRDVLQLHRRLASLHYVNAEYAKALREDRLALQISKDIRDLYEESQCERDIATCLRNLGKYPAAFRGYLRALRLGSLNPNLRNFSIIIGNAAELLLENGFGKTALSGARLAVQLLEIIDDSSYKMYFLQTFAHALSVCNRQNEGLITVNKSVNLAHSMNDYFEESNSRHTKAKILWSMGKTEDAVKEFERAYNLSVQTGHKFIEGVSKYQAVIAEHRTSSDGKADLDRLNSAINTLKAIRADRELWSMFKMLAIEILKNPFRNGKLIFIIKRLVTKEIVRDYFVRLYFKLWLVTKGSRQFRSEIERLTPLAVRR